METDEVVDNKICKYCGRSFRFVDSPQSFYRMITCGSPDCMGERRREGVRAKKRN